MTALATVTLTALAVTGSCTGRGDGLKSLAVEVTGGGDAYAYTAPTAVEAGVYTVTVTNRTQTDQHLDILRVDGGRSYQEVDAALDAAGEGGPLPEFVSSPGGVGRMKPGASRSATLKLVSGRYFLHNSDVIDPDNLDSKSYDQLGLVAELRVTGSTDDVVPDRGGLLVATDGDAYNFRVPPLKAGRNRVTFRNEGGQFHHVVAGKMPDGTTVEDVRAFLESDDVAPGDPPVDLDDADFLAALEPGGKMTTDLELTSGKYAFVCFLADKAGGPPHFTLGMLVEATVP